MNKTSRRMKTCRQNRGLSIKTAGTDKRSPDGKPHPNRKPKNNNPVTFYKKWKKYNEMKLKHGLKIIKNDTIHSPAKHSNNTKIIPHDITRYIYIYIYIYIYRSVVNIFYFFSFSQYSTED